MFCIAMPLDRAPFSPYKVCQWCIMALQMYCGSIGRFYNAQIIYRLCFGCWLYLNPGHRLDVDSRLLHISVHRCLFDSIRRSMIMHKGVSIALASSRNHHLHISCTSSITTLLCIVGGGGSNSTIAFAGAQYVVIQCMCVVVQSIYNFI